jgi:hypothetical protein
MFRSRRYREAHGHKPRPVKKIRIKQRESRARQSTQKKRRVKEKARERQRKSREAERAEKQSDQQDEEFQESMLSSTATHNAMEPPTEDLIPTANAKTAMLSAKRKAVSCLKAVAPKSPSKFA